MVQSIKIRELLPDTDWMEPEEGNVVFEKIVPFLVAGDVVSLSFEGCTLLLTPFLNGAIGQLYDRYDRTFVKEHVRYADVPPELDIDDKLARVEVNSINYYKNKDRIACDAVVNQELES